MCAERALQCGEGTGSLLWIGSYFDNFRIHTNLTNWGLDSESKWLLNNIQRNTETQVLSLSVGHRSSPGEGGLLLVHGRELIHFIN